MGVSASAVIDKLLKNRYRGDRLDAVMRNTFVGWKLCEPQKRAFSGRQEIFPVQLGWGGQVAARPEMGSGAIGANSDCSGAPLPAPPVVENGAVDIKQMFGTLMWTKQAILRCKDDAGAYKRLVNFELQNMQDRFVKELNFGFFGDGRGRRAQIAANALQAGGAAVTLGLGADTDLVLDTNRYLVENDLISIWDATDTTAASARIKTAGAAEFTEGNLYIKSVSDDGVTVTVHNGNAANSAALPAGGYIRFWGESDIQSGTIRTDHSIVGLSAAIDNGTMATTYAGISRTTYPKWNSFVKDAASAPLTEDMVIKCADAVNRKSGRKDRKIDTLILDPTIRRDYVKLTRPDRRYEGVDDTDPGYGDALVMTVGPQRFKILEDYDCPFGKVFGMARKDLECYVAQGVEIEEDAGGMLKMGTPYGKGGTGHVYWALVSWYGNFAFLRPYAAFLLKNLSYELESA